MKNLHRQAPVPVFKIFVQVFKILNATAAKLHLTRNFVRHCSKTALDEKKCGFPAVALKISKSHLGACRNKRLTMFLVSVKGFSIEDRV